MGTRKNWGNRPWLMDFRPAGRGLPPVVDVAVIGGGFTGLATAAWLKKISPRENGSPLRGRNLR